MTLHSHPESGDVCNEGQMEQTDTHKGSNCKDQLYYQMINNPKVHCGYGTERKEDAAWDYWFSLFSFI